MFSGSIFVEIGSHGEALALSRTPGSDCVGLPAYYLGCPVWACPHWVSKIFPAKCKRSEWLGYYSQAFTTVEGNSTFYGLPALETVKRWGAETAEGFHFALKFPKAVSHERELLEAERETRPFLEILQVLAEADRLGPSFLQLSPNFSGRQLGSLEKFLRALPKEFPYAVEVRHADWFDEGPFEARLDELLGELQIDKVTFDTRALFSAPPSDESEQESQRRKPRSPIRKAVTGKHPFLRIVGRNNVALTQPWLDEWGSVVADWISQGKRPFVFTHAPDDQFAPELAQLFHQTLKRSWPDVPDLPKWPGISVEPKARQLPLF